MARPPVYPRELRERSVCMVIETKSEYSSEFTAIESVHTCTLDVVVAIALGDSVYVSSRA
jgi:hypothetical protein